MRYFLVLGIFFGLSAKAASIECTAKVTIHQFHVNVDLDSSRMVIKTSTGATFEGSANHYSPSSGEFEDYFLPISFTSSILVEVEKVGQQRIALCLKDNECYLCR